MVEANYGYSIPDMMSVANALNIVDGTSSVSAPSDYSLELSPSCGWWYYPPTGETEAPFRQGDFREYDGEAAQVFGGVECKDMAAFDNSDIVGFIMSADDGYALSDFGSLSGSHFGVILRGSSKTVFIGLTYEWDYSGNTCYVSREDIATLLGTSYGNYEAVPVATTYAENTSDLTKVTCVPLPCGRGTYAFKTDTFQYQANITASATVGTTNMLRFTVKFTLSLKGTESVSVELANIYFTVTQYGSSGKKYESAYKGTSLTDIVKLTESSPTSSQYTVSFQEQASNYDDKGTGFVTAYYLQGSTYVSVGVSDSFTISKTPQEE
jgi:hypothetical protein